MSVPGDPGLEAGLKAAKHDLETATTEAENLKSALGKLLAAAYEAAGDNMPNLELQDTAGKAYRYTLNLLKAGPGGAAGEEQDRDAGAGPQSEVPDGTAPDEVTAARQRDRLLGAVHEAVRGGPPAAEDRAAYNYAEATADLAGLPDRDAGASEEGAEVSADTSAPAAEGENYQALGDIVRLIYEASGEEMPDLATEDGAAKAARFLASQEAAVPDGAAAALAGAIRAAYAACGGGAPNLETGDGQDTAQKFLVERMKKLADLETCRAPGAVADGAFIRVIYETSGEEMPDLETPEGYAHAHTKALSDLKASVRRRPEEDEVSTDTSAPAADGGGGENHPSLGGIDPSLGDIVRLVYEASGEEMPDLATEDGAAKAAQFLAGRQAVLAGEVKEIEKAFELRSSNAEKASDGLRKKARDAMDLFKALAVPIEAAFDNAGEAAPNLETPEGVEAVGKFFEALRVRGAAGEQDREAGASEEGGLADQLGQARAENAGLAEEASRLKTGLVTLAAAAGEDAGEAAADLDSEDGVAKAVRFFAAQLQAVPQAAVSADTAAPAAEGENYQALGDIVRLIYEASGEEMPDLATEDGAAKAAQFLAGQESEVPAGTAPDEDTAARQRDRLLGAVHEAVRGGPPAAEDRAAYNYAEATADLAGLPDRDAGASEEGGLADQLGQARAENAGLAEEASRLKTGLVTLAAAAGEDAGEAAADLDSEDGVAKAVRFFAAQLQAVPQAAVPADTAAHPPLAGAVQAIYDSAGQECPNLETPEGAEEARRFLVERIEATPDDDARALMAARGETAELRDALVLARAGKNKGGPWRRIVRIAAVMLLCAAVGGGWWTHKTAKESWEAARAAEAQRADNATAMSAVRAAENARLREKLSGIEAERDNAGSLAGEAQAETRLVRANAKKLLAAFTHACEVVPREKRRKIALCAAALAQACAALPAEVRPEVSFCRP